MVASNCELISLLNCHTKTKNCIYCGIEFIPKHGNQTVCGTDCRRLHLRKPSLPQLNCLYCGIAFTPKYPHQKCCNKEHGYLYGLNHRNEKYSFICKNCGKEYRTAYKDRDSYCSRECSDAHFQRHRPRVIIQKHCEYCGKEFSADIERCQKYCSEICGKRGYAGTVIKKEIACIYCGQSFMPKIITQMCCSPECGRRLACLKKYPREQIYICKECGKEFSPEYGNKHRNYCSDICMQKKLSRIGKSTRRAHIRGAKHTENFDPFYVFNRDKWRCRLCGTRTPRELRGTTEDYAPELDHIIPLAMGGDHTVTNTQCLCRRCNQEKGATIAGQLGLELYE